MVPFSSSVMRLSITCCSSPAGSFTPSFMKSTYAGTSPARGYRAPFHEVVAEFAIASTDNILADEYGVSAACRRARDDRFLNQTLPRP